MLNFGCSPAHVSPALLKPQIYKVSHAHVSRTSFRNALSRLRADGLVEREGWGMWKITAKGKEHVGAFMGHASRYEEYGDHALKKDAEANTVVIFDVPEIMAPQRARLRFELFALGFTMVQKSVWIGCGPLPASFIRYLRDTELISHVRIFSIKGSGTLISKIAK